MQCSFGRRGGACRLVDMRGDVQFALPPRLVAMAMCRGGMSCRGGGAALVAGRLVLVSRRVYRLPRVGSQVGRCASPHRRHTVRLAMAMCRVVVALCGCSSAYGRHVTSHTHRVIWSAGHSAGEVGRFFDHADFSRLVLVAAARIWLPASSLHCSLGFLPLMCLVGAMVHRRGRFLP